MPLLQVEENFSLKQIEKDYKLYFNKVSLFYGESGYGKGRIITEACFLLKDHIPVWFVISPTNSQNDQYTSMLDPIYIKSEISLQFLENLYQRQIYVSEIYKQANRIEILESLFNKCSDYIAKNKIEQINRIIRKRIKLVKYNRSLDETSKREHYKNIEETKIEYFTAIYKTIIRSNRESLQARSDLTSDEKLSLKFIDLNPNIGIIFDDCAAEIKKWGRAEVTKKMFYQGRHSNITSFWAFQDDKDISPALRKNGRNSIFTTSQCAISHFKTPSNGYSSHIKNKIEKIAEACFKQDQKVEHFRKLFFVKNTPEPFRFIVADSYPEFKLGCKSSWDFAKSIPRKTSESMNTKNPYLSKYILE